MIITNIAQIDNLVMEMLSGATGIVSMDMNDYTLLKQQSTTLEAVRVVIPNISEDTVGALEEEMKKLDQPKECSVLMYISGKGVNSDTSAVTMEQIQLLLSTIEAYIPADSDMLWGVGEHDGDDITVLVIIGVM